jgi:CHAD domain-containing protein
VNENIETAAIDPVPSTAVEKVANASADRARLEKQLAKQLRNFALLFSRVLADEEADAVHDLRVCTRRVQQILSGLAPMNSLGKGRVVRRTLRRIRRALGPWRNCDVALQWVARSERRSANPRRRRGWELVRQSITAERKRAINQARRRLFKSEGFALNQRARQLIALAAERLEGVDPAAVVRAAVDDGALKWREALARAMEDRSVQNVHALRIQMKRLRYRVELARDLGSDDARAVIQWFKSMQDRLGRWHDRQELSHFMTRALANSELLLKEPRVAVELLKEVEKDIAISAREVDAFFQLASNSEGRDRLDTWLKAFCHPAAGAAPAPAPGSAANGLSAAPEPEQQPSAPPPQPVGES